MSPYPCIGTLYVTAQTNLFFPIAVSGPQKSFRLFGKQVPVALEGLILRTLLQGIEQKNLQGIHRFNGCTIHFEAATISIGPVKNGIAMDVSSSFS